MQHRFVKTTVGAIVEKNGRILLALRNHEPFYNHWCIPGGHIDFSETVEDAMLREIKEETGLDVEEYTFFNYFTEYFKELDWHAVALIFIAKATGELKKQDKEDKEVKELKWYTIEEALNLPLAFDHKNILLIFQRDFL